MRRTSALGLSWSIGKLRYPPVHGYELSLLPDDSCVPEFLAEHKDGVVHVIIGNGENCEMTKKLTSVLHHTPLGQPKDVKLALLQGANAEKLIKAETIMALPTTLIYFRGKLVDRVVGTRPAELMTKSRFVLRNHDLSPFSS